MSLGADSINSCKYLFLKEIGEPSENELRLVINEAVSTRPISAEALSVHPPEIRELLSSAKEILHEPGCLIFEITWPSYIGYSVRNESYALPEPESSVGEGALFVEYEKSRFLDSVSASTFASADYPGAFKHWAMYCQNHIVDVASTESPIIKVRKHA
jgi:hypothetical protein